MSKKDSLILIETFNVKVISNWNAWFISEPSVTFNHCIHPPVSWLRQSQYESIFLKLWGKILYIYIIFFFFSSALFGSWDKMPQKNVRQPLAQLTADKRKKKSFYVSFLKLLAFNLIIYKARQLPQVTLSGEVKNFIFQKEIQVFNISKKYNIFWSPSKCNFSFCKPTC